MPHDHSPSVDSLDPSANRLDSWKEIAAYLDRGLRTVQRWEKELGLPVHRHSGATSGSGSVFAFRTEIDAWWESHRSDLGVRGPGESSEPAEAEEAPPERAAARGRLHIPWRAAAIVGLAALGLWAALSWRRAGPTAIEPEALTMRRIFELEAAPMRISPDGLRVPYADPKTQELLLADRSAAGEPSLLLERGQRPLRMAWSRDGSQLAVLLRPLEPSGSEVTRVDILDIEDGGRRVLWQGPANEAPTPFDWTPDGSAIVATIRQPDEGARLVAVSTKDGTVTPITEGLGGQASVSPDGRLVAFSACKDENCDIYSVPLRGGEPQRLTEHAAADTNPVWSPDGSHLLLLSDRLGDEGSLWALRIDPANGRRIGAPLLVREFGRRVTELAMTAEGELLFSLYPRAPRVHLLDVGEAGDKAELSAPLPIGSAGPLWIEGGAVLAYHEEAPWGPLRYFDPHAARDDQVGVPGHLRASLATPSPDGRSISFYRSVKGGRNAVWVYRAGDGDPAQPAHAFDGFLSPPIVWSADGSQLLFTVTRKTDRVTQEIRIVAAAGGEARTIARTTGRPPFPAWSPDGKQIAFTDGECIFAVPSAGEPIPPRRVTCAQSSDWTDPVRLVGPMGQLAWAPDGRSLVWIVHNPRLRRIEMLAVEADSGVERLLWAGEPDYESWPYRPSWAPNAETIAFELNYKRRYEIWALSGFLSALSGR